MQTFLPLADFNRSAKVLDWRRLGKQRVEAFQIIHILEGQRSAWEHHPAVKMWIGHEASLKAYFNAVSREWVSRGYQHNLGFFWEPYNVVFPEWFGDRRFHRSHQSNLVRKLPNHYRQFFPKVPDDLPYVWPITSSKKEF